MNKEISCAVAKDLLPNYIEKLTSDETNQILENHLSSCNNCANVRDDMMGVINIDKAPENPNLRKAFTKTKIMYLWKGIFLSVGILGILVSFIVDLAVNGKLTWSILVDVSVSFAYASILTAMYVRKNKVIKTSLVVSVMILPMLYIMEKVINKNYMDQPIAWFQHIALPITIIWLVIIWIMILTKKFSKLRFWNMAGVFVLFVMFGSAFTNSIGSKAPIYDYRENFEWINTIIYVVCATVCFVIGYVKKDRAKLDQ